MILLSCSTIRQHERFCMKISTLLLGLAGIVVSLALATSVSARSTVDVPMSPGWNFVSLPVSQRVTMQELCGQYPIIAISEYRSGQPGSWKEYQCSDLEKGKKIVLRERVGYMIRAKDAFTLQFAGNPITNYDYSHVIAGWTSIGVPMATQYNLKAHNLCGPLSGTTVDIVEVSAWVNGGWTSHICSIPQMNNFDLTDWSGYLVRSVPNTEATK